MAASLAWRGLAPPRAEILVWFVLHGRLNTKERLARLNIIPLSAALCPLCSLENETVEHLFFECMRSWRIWSDCFLWWELPWCCPNKSIAFFQAWCGAQFSGLERKMWVSLFYVVIWSLWNIRNRIVFEDFKPNWDLERRQIRLRWGFWLKAWMKDKNQMVEELSSNPASLQKWRWLCRRT